MSTLKASRALDEVTASGMNAPSDAVAEKIARIAAGAPPITREQAALLSCLAWRSVPREPVVTQRETAA